MLHKVKFFLLMLFSFALVACGGGGGSAGVPSGSSNPSNFRVNAPSEVTFSVGQVASYSISGGLAPYQVNNTAPNVVSATVVGNALEVSALRSGIATVTVSPAGGGASFVIAISVSSSANPLDVRVPGASTLQLGNSAIYEIVGGVPPYRAVSSAPGVLSAGVSGSSLQVSALRVGEAAVQVYDSVQGSSPAVRNFTVVSTSAFFSSVPSSLTMNLGTSRNFSVQGGVTPYFVSSSNSSVADASLSGGNLTIVAGTANGVANIVLRDSGGSSITVAVTVGVNSVFGTDAPEVLTLQGGSGRSFTFRGGTSPYFAASSNENIVRVAVSGNVFTLTAQNKGVASVRLTDSASGSILLAVTVDQGGSTTVGSIELTSSLLSINSSGQEAEIRALVKGANNVGISGADITFSTDSGILLAPSAQTDESGIAKVRLAAGSNKSNRTITVTARVGAIVQTITVQVGGTTITGPQSLNFQQSSAAVTTDAANQFVVRDSAGMPMPGVTLTVARKTGTTGLGNATSFTPLATDSTGAARLVYTPSIAGIETLVVSGAGATSGDVNVSVSSILFDFVDPTPAAGLALLPVNQGVLVRVRLAGVPQVDNRTIRFSTSRGTFSATTVQTNSAGEAEATLTSPSAGGAILTVRLDRIASDPGSGQVGSLLVERTRQVSFTGVTPASLRLQINPGAIPPNTAGSETNRAAVTATVTDAGFNPVSNVPVDFVLSADPSNGRLSAGIANTGSDGVARVDYIAGTSSTANDAVRVTARALGGTQPQDTRAMTVNGNSLFINIGIGNEITNLDPATYSKPLSVYVTDASGNAVANQNVNLQVLPINYLKGRLAWNGVVWAYTPIIHTCSNEDLFFASGNAFRANGILDAGEDFNGDGRLNPGNVIFVSPSDVRTDSSGVAVFTLRYGEQYAPWLTVDLIARAQVSGTESVATARHDIRGLSTDFSVESAPPAGVVSPFGVNVCSTPN